MDRDLRPTALYQAIAAHFERALVPGFGRISGAADPSPSPDGQRIAFTGSRWARLEGLPQTRICLLSMQSGAWEEITAGPHNDLLSGVDALVARGLVDPARVGVMGVSYGGYMTSWLITQTERFAAAVAMSPSTDWISFHYTTYFPDFDRLFLQDTPSNVMGRYVTRSPIMAAERVRTPTLHTTGGLDEATPAGQAIEFHHALLEQGVPSSLAIYPQEGHDVHRFPAVIDRSTRVVAWFERFMPARPRGAEASEL